MRASFMLACALCVLLTVATAQTIEPISASANYVVYMTPWFPLVMCPTFDTRILKAGVPLATSQNSSKSVWQGYELDLIVDTIQALSPDSTIELRCVTQEILEDSLYVLPNDTDKYYFGIGGRRTTISRLKNFTVSTFTMNSGLRLVIRKDQKSRFWSAVAPFTWTVGAMYIGALFVVGTIIWLFEERDWHLGWRRLGMNAFEVIYDVASAIFFVNRLTYKTFASRIMLWFMQFNVLILMILYQADLVEKLSTRYVKYGITSFEQGRENGYTFGFWSEYNDYITSNYDQFNAKYSSNYTMNQATDALVQTMFSDLRQQYVDALLLDAPLAQYYQPMYCFSLQLEDIIWEFNYVVLMQKFIDSTFLAQFNVALEAQRNSLKYVNKRKQIFEMKQVASCPREAEHITLTNLSGLWIAIGAAFGLSLLVWASRKIFHMNVQYENPYLELNTDKTAIFEEQLVKAVSVEVSNILDIYKKCLFFEIDSFERALMLQEFNDKSLFIDASNDDTETPLHQVQLQQQQQLEKSRNNNSQNRNVNESAISDQNNMSAMRPLNEREGATDRDQSPRQGLIAASPSRFTRRLKNDN